MSKRTDTTNAMMKSNRKDLQAKKDKKAIIPVFFAVDDKYAPYLCVALRSLIDNSSKRNCYRIYVLIEALSEENKSILSEMQTENVRLEFVNVSQKLKTICARLHLRDYYTKATYYRFFIPELFTEYDRGVYLDCDIILTADVAALYRCPMGKNLVAAVNDEIISDIDVFSRYSETVLGISRHDYFNAGILIMNLKEMRSMRIEEQFATLLGQRTYRVAQDQDYLNKLCHGRVHLLPLKWNKTPMPSSDERILPKIAHYKINYKPWKYDGIPYGELFWQYAAKTPFFEQLTQEKAQYSEAEKLRDRNQYLTLEELAEEEVRREIGDGIRSHALAFAEG